MSDIDDDSEARTTGAEPGGIPTRAAGAGEVTGQVIGRYKLLEELGEGGMGTVWMAQQSEPVQRRVALKIIKLGMDTREVVARFEVERQALALMDHPHIAKVLDAGATDNGRPYFVMELVRGVPITTYCDQAKLGLQERLELFTKVCHALQHAHQKGIIHRDVKPSNVLVSLQDGVPLPKVIDFGIAKATSSELTQQTLYTKLSQVIGTPEYMAPEQAESGGLDIDTRADIYSLGVLLYEMLTGTKPLDLGQAMAAGLDELLRVIREDDPPKPSTRISSLGESASSTAGKRRVDSQVLSRRLRGDLDWIVMKALEKDRTRRYETANGFAEDIANYLNDEPVAAAPPSARYRLSKLLRRRKKTVATVATIALLMIAGSVGTGFGWWKTVQANRSLDVALDEKVRALSKEAAQRLLAEENERRARAAEAQALAEAERATKAEVETQARADELEQVAAFQAEQLSELDVSLMGVRLRAALLEAAPEDQRAALDQSFAGINFTNLSLATLRDNLFERTIEAIDMQFRDQPLVQAQLLQTTARTWRELGLLEIAMDPELRALDLRRKNLGDEHPATLDSVNGLGVLLYSQGKLSEAEVLYREALEGRRRVLGDEHPSTLTSIGNLGFLYFAQGKHSKSEALLRESLNLSRRVLGAEHPSTLSALNNLGSLLSAQERFSESMPLFQEATEVKRRVLGDEHPSTMSSVSNLGYLLYSQGKLSEAEPLYQEALDNSRKVLGDEHPDTLTSIGNMGTLLESQGKLSEAEALYREALESNRRVLGDEHANTLIALNNLGALFQTQGKLSEAEPLYRQVLATSRRILGAEHPDTLSSIYNLGFLLYSEGKLSEAEPLLWEAANQARRILGDANSLTQYALQALEQLLQARLRAARIAGERELGAALSSLGSVQVLRGSFREAEGRLVEALDLLLGMAREGDPAPWYVQVQLALALAGQGRFDEAQGILDEGSQRLLEQADPRQEPERLGWPGTVVEVLQANVDFYAAWHAAEPGKGHDLKAANWQIRLDDSK